MYIKDFLSAEDFAAIISAPEIATPPAHSDENLFEILHGHGYKMIEFPGCITNQQEYIEWHRSGKTQRKIHSACEGFGVTLRLYDPKTPILVDLIQFLQSAEFNEAMACKFGLDFENCTVDNGIQKYLDGYEISPHPDIRRKAATFMVNINPHENSEQLEHHTSYLRLKGDRRNVREFWESHTEKERAWVPWTWCDVVKTQPENNSIVLFAPSNDTIHAVRAAYDHLPSQRTQLYGNLWHKDIGDLPGHSWELLDQANRGLTWTKVKSGIKEQLPQPAKVLLGRIRDLSSRTSSDRELGKRNI